MSWWGKLLAAIAAYLKNNVEVTTVPPPIVLPVIPPPMPTPADKLYTLSKSLIGKHLSLNDAVPWLLGCAEAVSNLLVQLGTPYSSGIPKAGIEGTQVFLDFFINSPHFEERSSYSVGCIVIAASGTGTLAHGHMGVGGYNSIMSNNSKDGKWDTVWDIVGFIAYYQTYGGIHTRYFVPV